MYICNDSVLGVPQPVVATCFSLKKRTTNVLSVPSARRSTV